MKIFAIIISLLLAASAFAGTTMIKKKATSPTGISDDFGSDTSANYTIIEGGGILVNDGGNGVWKAANWQYVWAYHETTTGSNNNYSQALIKYPAQYESGGVLCRVTNGATPTGYISYMYDGDVLLHSFSGATLSAAIAIYDGTYTYGSSSTYTMKIECNSGNTIRVLVDTIERISVTDTTYTNGAYVGLSSNRGGNSDSTVDTFRGGSL